MRKSVRGLALTIVALSLSVGPSLSFADSDSSKGSVQSINAPPPVQSPLAKISAPPAPPSQPQPSAPVFRTVTAPSRPAPPAPRKASPDAKTARIRRVRAARLATARLEATRRANAALVQRRAAIHQSQVLEARRANQAAAARIAAEHAAKLKAAAKAIALSKPQVAVTPKPVAVAVKATPAPTKPIATVTKPVAVASKPAIPVAKPTSVAAKPIVAIPKPAVIVTKPTIVPASPAEKPTQVASSTPPVTTVPVAAQTAQPLQAPAAHAAPTSTATAIPATSAPTTPSATTSPSAATPPQAAPSPSTTPAPLVAPKAPSLDDLTRDGVDKDSPQEPNALNPVSQIGRMIGSLVIVLILVVFAIKWLKRHRHLALLAGLNVVETPVLPETPAATRPQAKAAPGSFADLLSVKPQSGLPVSAPSLDSFKILGHGGLEIVGTQSLSGSGTVIYLVKAGDRMMLLGASPQGGVRTLSEWDSEETRTPEEQKESFDSYLRQQGVVVEPNSVADIELSAVRERLKSATRNLAQHVEEVQPAAKKQSGSAKR